MYIYIYIIITIFIIIIIIIITIIIITHVIKLHSSLYAWLMVTYLPFEKIRCVEAPQIQMIRNQIC